MSKKIKNSYLKSALIGVLAIICYIFLPSIGEFLLAFFDIPTENISGSAKTIIAILSELITMIAIILLFYHTLKKDIQDMKKNHQTYFKKYFPYWLLALFIMMMSNLFITFLEPNSVPANEQAIRDLLKINPIYIYFSSVIFAPMVEELVFRQAFKNILKNKYLFIFLSGFVFGSLHVLLEPHTTFDLLYLIPYCTPGFIFAYILEKTDNVLVSMGLHFVHNGILIALQFLIYFIA